MAGRIPPTPRARGGSRPPGPGSAARAGRGRATPGAAGDPLPPGTVSVSAGGRGWTCGELSGTVPCPRPLTPPGASRTITIQVTAPASAGTLTNSVLVSASERDPNTANNNASADTTVVAAPSADLAIAKSDGGVSGRWNQPLVYTIVATNNGPAPVTGATVSDNVPGVLTGVTWSCAGTGGGSCAGLGAGNINDSTVNLPAGASVTYTVTG